jgi:hypothetical protein
MSDVIHARVQARHLKRNAYLDVRQSTLRQVLSLALVRAIRQLSAGFRNHPHGVEPAALVGGLAAD